MQPDLEKQFDEIGLERVSINSENERQSCQSDSE